MIKRWPRSGSLWLAKKCWMGHNSRNTSTLPVVIQSSDFEVHHARCRAGSRGEARVAGLL